MKYRVILASACALFLASGPLALADYDVAPSVSGGQIRTNAFDDGTDDYVANVRVFTYGFDEPYFTEDPGFHPQPSGSANPSGFSDANPIIVKAVSGLLYWDGAGEPSFTAVPNEETLNLAFGSFNFTVGDSAPAATISLGNTISGGFDRHLESTLSGPGGSDPTLGLYLVALQLSNNGVTASDPFYVIYNTGDDDELSDAAATYVRDTFAPGSNLVPEPSMALALAAAFVVISQRRRCTGF